MEAVATQNSHKPASPTLKDKQYSSHIVCPHGKDVFVNLPIDGQRKTTFQPVVPTVFDILGERIIPASMTFFVSSCHRQCSKVDGISLHSRCSPLIMCKIRSPSIISFHCVITSCPQLLDPSSTQQNALGTRVLHFCVYSLLNVLLKTHSF